MKPFDVFFLYSFCSISVYCNWTFDSFLCWPPTRAGDKALQHCPSTRGLDPSSKSSMQESFIHAAL